MLTFKCSCGVVVKIRENHLRRYMARKFPSLTFDQVAILNGQCVNCMAKETENNE